MNPETANTCIRKIRAIDGWFWPSAGYLFALLDEIQKAACVTGPIFEIGAYHGKSAVLLAHMLDSRTETLGVCDTFGATGVASGSPDAGFLDRFERNMREYGPAGVRVRVHRKNAADLTVRDTSSDCRFFHIDGGHSAADVVRDLGIAADALQPDGVVVLDDFHNFAWPGVAEGFFRFMNDRPGVFEPLVMGFNKGVLVRPDARGLYQPAFEDPERCWRAIPRGPFALKTVELCGVDAFLFHTPSYRSPDPRRTIFTTLYQHRPRLADALVRCVGYHTPAGV